MFAPIEGASALLRKRNGVYSESLCYERNKRLHVKTNGGFIRVLKSIPGELTPTTHPLIKVAEFSGLSVGDYVT